MIARHVAALLLLCIVVTLLPSHPVQAQSDKAGQEDKLCHVEVLVFLASETVSVRYEVTS